MLPARVTLLLPVAACLAVAALPPRASALQEAPAGELAARLQAITAASGAEVAVAYRTLDGRDQLLQRGDDVFHAASTMKVPVMIELFRQAERGLLRLDGKIPVVNGFQSIVDGSSYTLSAEDDSEAGLYQRVGQPITYRELCELMITVSSNLATNILIDRLSPQRIQQTSVELGAGGMQVVRGVEDAKAYQAGRNNTTTARALLVLMQAIAEGRAVSPAASKEMVEILKRQKASDGIPAGLPRGTAVAHKTGEISTVNHDAAIVYAPRPYVLVVLVRGLESKAREKLIADVSRAVYETSQQPPPASR